MKAMLRPRPLLIAATGIFSALWMADAHAAPTIDAHWTGVSLREVAARLTDRGGVAIVVDRRLDPSAPIALAASGEPLDTVLEAVAAQGSAEVALLDGHARIAPAAAAALARAGEAAREQEIRRLEPKLQRLAQARRAWTWPDGAQPRDLLAAAAAEAGIAIEGLGRTTISLRPTCRRSRSRSGSISFSPTSIAASSGNRPPPPRRSDRCFRSCPSPRRPPRLPAKRPGAHGPRGHRDRRTSPTPIRSGWPRRSTNC
jgi:hypothetical protein